MTHSKFIWLIPLLALCLTACDISLGGLPQAKTGPTTTTNINVPLPSAGIVTDVTIALGGGSLDLAGGASALVEGTVQTNVAEWKPTVTNALNNVVIAQGQSSPIPDSTDTVNKWNLRLGKAPMNLTVKTGATNGTFNLGGVPLRGLHIEQGAASTDIKFASANPEVMKELFVSAGAANISLSGLGNANFETLTFNGGASNYTLDFTGKLQRSATATIRTGVSNVTVIVPDGVNAKATLTGGLRGANYEGAWQKSGDAYTLAGSGPTLTLNVEMALGALQLKNK
ncbi:MAG: toast rack family protein [Chloroflexota bacterium]